MKRYISILVVIIICFAQTPVFKSILNFSGLDTKAWIEKGNTHLAEEEPLSSTDDPGNDRAADQENFYTKHHHIISNQFQLSAKDRFVCYGTTLNKPPFNEDDLRPPNP
ncbi:MAG: hypothetical protein WKI04_09845 [Ferruginibacter sp.]